MKKQGRADCSLDDVVEELAELIGDYESHGFSSEYKQVVARRLAVQSKPRLQAIAKRLARAMTVEAGWTFSQARFFKRAFAKHDIKFTVRV